MPHHHTNQPDPQHAPDVCLLLRAHCESHWLQSELLPVLEQLEQPTSLPEEQRAAALAYLEVLTLDAHMRAGDTDHAGAQLQRSDQHGVRFLAEEAYLYHTAVRRQRSAVAARVDRLLVSRSRHQTRRHSTNTHQHASF